MQYSVLFLAVFTFFSHASDTACEAKLVKHQVFFENHVTLTYMDKLESLLFIREEIINEGAISSQVRLDQQLFSSIKSVLNSQGVQPDQVERIETILETFKTFPLMVSPRENIELNEMVNKFGA